MNKCIAFSSLFAFTLASAPDAAHAQAAPGLGDLVGARAPGAENELNTRGYRPAGNKGGGSLWWNERQRACAVMYVEQGRVAAINRMSGSDCGKGGGDSTAAAVAGVAALGLIAALAAHKKKSDSRHADGGDHDSDYTRGYNDAMYDGGYDRQDSEAYHEGFMAGEAERQNRRAANSRFVRGAPAAAQQACMRRGDDYLGMPAGSTVPVSVDDYGGGSYEIVVASGHYRARCDVDAGGRVRDINPY